MRSSALRLGGGARQLGAEPVDRVDAIETDEHLSGRSVARVDQLLAERAPQVHGLPRPRPRLALLVCHARIMAPLGRLSERGSAVMWARTVAMSEASTCPASMVRNSYCDRR
jgi:hypothetical protein